MRLKLHSYFLASANLNDIVDRNISLRGFSGSGWQIDTESGGNGCRKRHTSDKCMYPVADPG